MFNFQSLEKSGPSLKVPVLSIRGLDPFTSRRGSFILLELSMASKSDARELTSATGAARSLQIINLSAMIPRPMKIRRQTNRYR